MLTRRENKIKPKCFLRHADTKWFAMPDLYPSKGMSRNILNKCNILVWTSFTLEKSLSHYRILFFINMFRIYSISFMRRNARIYYEILRVTIILFVYAP